MNILFDEVIISSGSIKGCAIIGALNKFFNYYPLKRIKYFTGCSIGSVLCFLLNINYNIKEINEILFCLNFDKFQDLKLKNLFEKCGFDEGIKFTNLFKALLIQKKIDENITFNELFNLTKQVLTINTVNITKGVVEYHNYLNTPNLSVVLSLRMSINIPILFSPILYNENYYVDGALLEPFPYHYMKNTNKIGFWLFDKYEFDFFKEINVTFVSNINNSVSYIYDLLKIIYTNYMKEKYKIIPKNVIYINIDFSKKDIESFNMDINEKIKLFNIGKKKCKKFIKSIMNESLKRKYFNKWKKIKKGKF